MALFGFNTQENEDLLNNAAATPYDPARDSAPSWYSGALSAIPKGIGSGLNEMGLLYGDAITPYVNAFSRPIDENFGTSLADDYGTWKDNNLEMLESLRPDPQTTGWLGEVVYGLGSIVPPAIAGAWGGPPGIAASIGATKGYAATRNAQESGADDLTSIGVGAIEGVTQAAGVLMPAAIPGKLATRMLSGAAMNVGMGMASRGATGALLDANGYKDMAEQYKVLDGVAILTDGILGAGFGALHIDPETRVRPSPSEIDAALAGNNIHQLEIESAPGIPSDIKSRNAHINAMNTATEQLLRGELVDVAQIVGESNLLQKEIKPESSRANSDAITEGGYHDIAANQERHSAAKPIEASPAIKSKSDKNTLIIADDGARAADDAARPATLHDVNPAMALEVGALSTTAIETPTSSGKVSLGSIRQDVATWLNGVLKRKRGSKAEIIDVSEYNHTIDASDIRHAWDRHGEGNEKSRNNIPLTKEDFKRIPDIIANPDEVKLGTSHAKQPPSISYIKHADDGTDYVAEHIRTDKNTLEFKTMYRVKRKVEGNLDGALMNAETLPSPARLGSDLDGSPQQPAAVQTDNIADNAESGNNESIAAQIIAEKPDMELPTETGTLTVSEALNQADTAIADATEFSKLFEVAATCAIRNNL